MNFKWGLIGYTGRDLENSDTESNIGYYGSAQDSSEKNNSKCPRDCSCDSLVKNVASFCSCPKTLPEDKLKNFELIPLADET